MKAYNRYPLRGNFKKDEPKSKAFLMELVIVTIMLLIVMLMMR